MFTCQRLTAVRPRNGPRKLVYNRAGEYFYNAACSHHWAKSDDDTYSAVANDLVIGVNDKSNTAAFGGRFTTHFLERNFPPDRFTLSALQRGSE
jgi:hypothetical protein